MRLNARLLNLLAVGAALLTAIAAQTASGTPPFSTVTGSSLDQIDLANLNTHFNLPIFSRRGRGLPLDISLAGDPQAFTA